MWGGCQGTTWGCCSPGVSVWAVSCPRWKIWSHRAPPQKLRPVSFSDIVACYSLSLESFGCCTLRLCFLWHYWLNSLLPVATAFCSGTASLLCSCTFQISSLQISACTWLPLSLKCCRPAHFPFGFVEPPVRGLFSLQGCCNILGAP